MIEKQPQNLEILYHKNLIGGKQVTARVSIFAILALINKLWLQLEIFAIIFAAGAVILLMSVHILFWNDILKESLEKCRNE